jgi:hypothetical protein
MEAIRSSETSVNTTSTRCHIPEDCFLHSHRRESLKSYVFILCLPPTVFLRKKQLFYMQQAYINCRAIQTTSSCLHHRHHRLQGLSLLAHSSFLKHQEAIFFLAFLDHVFLSDNKTDLFASSFSRHPANFSYFRVFVCQTPSSLVVA